MSIPDKLKPFNDPRITHGFARLSTGVTYHYLYAIPKHGKWNATIFLIHGWPDLSFGWRYQIPMLLEQGFRVVAPDMIGYGSTDAPHAPPHSLDLYSLKRVSDDIAELAKAVDAPKIVLAGHDWGGFVVYRCAEWHSDLVTHVISVCTPYNAPTRDFVSLDDLIARAPQFAYQKHLASGELEQMVQTKEQLRNFLRAMYGGKPINGKKFFDPRNGLSFDALPGVEPSPLVSEDELDLYVEEYSKHGLHGPCNWYRMREINWRDEQQQVASAMQMAFSATVDNTYCRLPRKGLDCPVLFIIAENDSILLPSMARGIEKHLSNVSVKSVPAAHWALWQTPGQVNEMMSAWLMKHVASATPPPPPNLRVICETVSIV